MKILVNHIIVKELERRQDIVKEHEENKEKLALLKLQCEELENKVLAGENEVVGLKAEIKELTDLALEKGFIVNDEEVASEVSSSTIII